MMCVRDPPSGAGTPAVDVVRRRQLISETANDLRGGKSDHRLRVEHNRETLLIHLSGETREGWLVLAVGRATRRWAVGEARRQIDAPEHAFNALYGEP